MVGGGESGVFEDSRTVEHYTVDAGGLLEEVDADGRDQDMADGRCWAEEEILPDVFTGTAAFGEMDDVVGAMGRDSGSLFDVSEAELGFVRGVGGTKENGRGVGEAALHDEPARRFGHEENDENEESRGEDADSEHESPSQVSG